MSKLNINRNIFLEKEELRRFQEFLDNDITKILFVKNTVSFGLVLSDYININPNDFLIQVGTNVGTVKLLNDSFALDSEGKLIHLKAFDNLSVPNDGAWYWMKITHKYDPTEVGTCSVDSEGSVSGLNTLFGDVLRGQSTEVPVKIKFRKADGSTLVNDQVYEVVDVLDDTNILLTGGTFQAESNLQYIVVGSTPISEILTNEQLTGLYQYDSCDLKFIAEEQEGEAPEINYTENIDFYIARVKNDSGVITLQDKRSQWWSFNIPGLGDKMVKTNNLSDLANLVQARANLGVYSKAEVDAAFGSYIVPNTTFLNKSAKISPLTGYGQYNRYNVVWSGVFTVLSGQSFAPGDRLFSMALPSSLINTPLAFFHTFQTGSFDNSRNGLVKIVKNGDNVDAIAVTTIYDSANVGFNVTWLR